MPEKETIERARRDRREGKAPTTQAGEFVREEIEHVREGKHGTRSTKQAIAIGLSKARRAGVELPPPEPGRTSPETRERAIRDNARGGCRPPAEARPEAVEGHAARAQARGPGGGGARGPVPSGALGGSPSARGVISRAV